MLINVQTRRLSDDRVLVARCASTDNTSQFHEIQLPEGISPEQFETALAAWQSGELIQDALSFLHREDREFLISGITPERWMEIFGSEEDQWGAEEDAGV